ncbi:Shwachman-Bodian-diamond syndrome protein [Hyphopichia burtonii NRRL Y-1933]|uniref:Ribosome maturation protein SDO1 n=1 Tax=Hyphopichia burtonii NRRL Y-1933 TaxID=984485 RepID=A0A1E4RH99_9ASCO|nr:Shwachman-Bodian-diamond syndrome protein [Hyphopichia burtonii NRRL Y-1933]ODV66643.1 Shwachman-Bodian-diamond syndrome protein [Hyphopichia burtonii NRRL Y-1933]
MAVINQPSNQIKLTNVSLVRMKKGRKRFEIACYQNKVQDWRLKVEKDLDEVLQIPQVFTNVSKGQVANNEDLLASFGKTNHDEIILQILDKGEIQLNEKERSANLQQKNNEFLNIISTKCINPKSKKRYPPSMIQKALIEVKFHLNPNKPTKLQALEAIKLLIAKQVFPISRAQMKIKLIFLNKVPKSIYEDHFKSFLDKIEDETQDTKTFETIAIIDPTNYRVLVDLLQGENAKVKKGEGSIEVLDMAAIKE